MVKLQKSLEARALVIGMVAALVIAGLTQAAHASDWPMFRGDSTNSGYTSETLTPPLKLAWKAKVDGIALSSPVTSQGMVYAGSTSAYVYALDANTGLERWKYKTGGWIRWSPAVASGMVYVSSEDGYVYALDKNTGELRWKERPRSPYSKPVSSLIVVEDIVYVISKGSSVVDSGVCALNALTGESKWCAETSPEAVMDGASPAISSGILYIGIYDSLHAFDAKDGKLKWKYQTKSESTARIQVGMPSVSNGVVYFSTSDYLYAIDASTGKEIWKGGPAPIRSAPSIANNTLYVTGYNGAVGAMDSMTGAPSWTYSYSAPSILFSPPTISDNIVYIGSGPYLQAIDAQNGILKWSHIVDTTLSSSPAIANNRLYIGSNGYVYAFEKSEEPLPLIPTKIPLPLKEIPLFEGYSLIFSKLSFENGKKEERIAEFELQKDRVKVDSGGYKQGNIVQLGNKDKGLPIIKGTLDSIFKGATTDMVQLKDITVYSDSAEVIVSDIGKITLSHVLSREEVGSAYWKLDNGYWLYLDVYTRSNKAIFNLEKYGINIDRMFVSVGQEFSLKNDTGAVILSGTFEGITKQDNRIVAKFTNIIQYPDSRVDTKILTNLTDDELKNIQSEKNNEYKPSQIIMWNLSDGYYLRLQAIDPKTTPRQAWLIFTKDGQKLNDMVVAEGQQFSHQKQVTDGNSKKDITILSGNLDRISLDPYYVVISDVNLYSEWSGKPLGEGASFDVPSAISSAQTTINDARKFFADTSQAEYLLGQAQEKIWNGQYAESMGFAVQAKESAEGVRATRMKQYGIGSVFIISFTVITYFRATANKRKMEKIKIMKQQIEKWESEGYDVSEFKNRWL